MRRYQRATVAPAEGKASSASSEVMRLVKSLGFSLDCCESVTFTPSEIRIVTHRLNSEGRKFVIGVGSNESVSKGDVVGELAKDEHVFHHVVKKEED